MSPAGFVRVTAKDRRALLRDLLDCQASQMDGGGVLWNRLTGRGLPTANKLIADGHARLDVKYPGGWLLRITEDGKVALLESQL